MVQSNAATVSDYLKSLPPERRKVVAAVRRVMRANMPAGFVEGMQYGGIGYYVPLKRHPETYNGRPLIYAGLAAQKQYYAVYLMCIYSGPEQKRLRADFAKAGQKLDMGKCCVRFRKLENLPLDVVGRAIASTTVEEFITRYESVKRE